MSRDTSSEQGQLQSNPKIAFSEKLDDFRAALDVLYISKNLSGRNKFREKWPVVALHLFGPTLIEYDNHGTENLEDRKALEESAEHKRIDLKNILAEFEEKSVEAGFLKLEYIGQIIDQVSIDIATYLYAEKVIERARPGLLKKAAPAPEIIPSVQDEKLSSAEVQLLKNNETQNTPPVPSSGKPLPPKGTLKNLFNWLGAQKS